MLMAEAKISLNRAAVQRVADNSQRLDKMLATVAEKIVAAAKADFVRQNRGDNELRTSETTPPKYMASFYVEKFQDGEWRAGNKDPAWKFVEFGAHAGGNPNNFVLRYRPLGHGFDAVAGGQ